jgi:AraC family transcriptional regulator, regulatory protein of adaptative response / methylated-DNA-[protein]-cysteine methyltransferase
MNTQIHFGLFKSPLGLVLIAASARGICSITLGDAAPVLTGDLERRFPDTRMTRDDAKLRREFSKVAAFIDDPARGLDIALDTGGTEFQQRVWRALREIPAGERVSYAEIARRIDAPTSFRAVAQACGANRIALAIPCHRVVRADGGISGYRWGVSRKRALLDKEAGKRALLDREADKRAQPDRHITGSASPARGRS